MPRNPQKLYQMFDRVSRAVDGPIILYRADGPAIRSFYQVLANAQTLPGQHPADFDLICIGEQEDDGTIIPIVPPVAVALGAAWVETQQRSAAAAAPSQPQLEVSR